MYIPGCCFGEGELCVLRWAGEGREVKGGRRGGGEGVPGHSSTALVNVLAQLRDTEM